jgi:hypothetical protein
MIEMRWKQNQSSKHCILFGIIDDGQCPEKTVI